MRLAVGVLALVLLFAGPALSPQPSEADGLPVRFRGRFECLGPDSANFYLTVRNLGARPLDIKGDFHVTAERIRLRAHKPIAILFVFPAPTHDPIPAGAERTFVLPIGGEGDPEADLRAKEIRIETEFWFEKHGHVYRRYMSFPGCRTARRDDDAAPVPLRRDRG